MSAPIPFEILPQPDLTTCGPTCLHAIYRYYRRERALDEVVNEVSSLAGGGTLGVMLGCHALKEQFKATIYTYNLSVFDPTWFGAPGVDMRERLARQAEVKPDPKLREATRAYREYLDLGGRLRMEDLTVGLIRKYLKRGVPVLAGLSITYLYRCKRDLQNTMQEDDVAGEPTGHFVVLCGYDPDRRQVLVADPYQPNPLSGRQLYEVPIERVLCSILLGIVTYDANLVIIEPRPAHKKE